jgi:hypothetical protein
MTDTSENISSPRLAATSGIHELSLARTVGCGTMREGGTGDPVLRLSTTVAAIWGTAMAHAEEAASVAGGTRPRSWLGFKFYLISVAALIALMQIPWLDPARFDGRPLVVSMTVAWCAGLLVLALGVARRAEVPNDLRGRLAGTNA